MIDEVTVLASQMNAMLESLDSGQKRIEASEEKYRMLVEHQGEGIILCDFEEQITFANLAADAIIGVPTGTLAGRRFTEFISLEAAEQLYKQTSRRKQGEKSKYDLEIIRPSGERRILMVTAVPQLDTSGRPVGALAILQDFTEQKRSEKLQAALYYISEAAAKTENLQSLYAVIHDAVKQLINTNNFYIALYDENDQMISFPYWVDEFDQPPQPRKMGDGLTDQVLKTGVPLLTAPEVPKLLEGQGLSVIGTPSVEWAGVPMKVGGRTIGALVVQTYRKSERFGEDALSILSFMSDNIALAIERKNVEMELMQNNDTQNALAALLNLSLGDISLEKLLNNTIDIILSIPWLALESRGSIALVEDDPGVLVMKAQRNLAHPIQQACARVPFGKCLCGLAALTGQIQYADCLDDHHEITYNGIIPHGHYCVPILFGQKTLGVINLYIKEGHHRSKMEELFLTSMADALAGVIQRKRTETSLAASEERFKQVADNAAEWVWARRAHWEKTLLRSVYARDAGRTEPGGTIGFRPAPTDQGIRQSEHSQRRAGGDIGNERRALLRTRRYIPGIPGHG
jgi:PAS domain S-box-containing protein